MRWQRFLFGTVLGKSLQIVGVVLIDQLTKKWAESHVKGFPSTSYFGDLFRFEYAENSGAFLSLGAALSADTRFWIFVVAVAIFLFFALFYLYRDSKLDYWNSFALAMISSGGIGNLIDRTLRVNHGVVDFMNMGIGSLRTGIFNVADMAIMAGVFVLAGKSLKKQPDEQSAESPNKSKT